MFYGGFCLKFDTAKPVLVKAMIILILGVILTGGFVGLFCYRILKTSLFEGMLIGAVVASTDAALALLAYALPSVMNGNGFLSVYLFGIILGNSKLKKKTALIHFFDSISHMMQILLFFLLGLLCSPLQIIDIILPAVLIALFLTFVARPLTVFICLTPFKVPLKQQLFISWCGL